MTVAQQGMSAELTESTFDLTVQYVPRERVILFLEARNRHHPVSTPEDQLPEAILEK